MRSPTLHPGLPLQRERSGALPGGGCEAGPARAPLPVQFQRAAHHAQHLVAHVHDVLAGIVVGERDGGLVAERGRLGSDLELAVHHDPVRLQLQVSVVEDEGAPNVQASQPDVAVEHDRLPGRDGCRRTVLGDLTASPRWPGRTIAAPERALRAARAPR